MASIRRYTLSLLLLWPLLAIAQSHDFEVRDFHENMTDLSAVSSNVKDLNGITAALIRFAVRDTLFTFDANLGIVKQKKETGEVHLYVPQGTKRITIRHPYLGVLRDYQIPIDIVSKTTYDAEIIITNVDYLKNIFGHEQNPPVNNLPEIVYEEPSVEYPTPEITPKVRTPKAPTQSHFLIGGGYNALGVMGPTAMIGLEIGSFFVSADYTFGLEKVEGVGIYYKQGGNVQGMGEAYDYSVSRFSARLGFNTSPKAAFQVVPQIGASFNMINGDGIASGNNYQDQFAKSTPLSLSAAISLRVRLFGPLYLYVTPQYDFVVGADDVYKVIKEADNKIKSWGEGFGVSAGLLLRF